MFKSAGTSLRNSNNIFIMLGKNDVEFLYRPRNYFPDLPASGNKVVRVVASSPDDALNLT